MDLHQTVFVLIFFSGIIPHCRSARNNKLDWRNPCQYRNRPVREARSLNIQVKIALQEYKIINTTIATIYKTGDMKEIFATKNDITTTKGLLKFYRDFYKLGKKTEKALTQKLITDDNKFNHTARTFTLTKMRDMTVSIMCELFDVVKKKPSIGTVIDTKSNVREPTQIRRQANLTQARAIDTILSITYNKLLVALRKSLHRRNNKRKANAEDDRKKRRRKKCTPDKKC